jgi:hypothetical protein
MVTLAFIFFVLVACMLSTIFGVLAHFARAHFSYTPEDLGLGEPWDTLTRDGYQFEKNVIGAQWDDNGFWDSESNRNLAYYAISGFVSPLIFAGLFWGHRAEFVGWTCSGLIKLGLQPIICV